MPAKTKSSTAAKRAAESDDEQSAAESIPAPRLTGKRHSPSVCLIG